jgi:hypothetical protein
VLILFQKKGLRSSDYRRVAAPAAAPGNKRPIIF